MIPNDMKTEEQPPQLIADQDKLIDEIIDLKQKLNAMVRLADYSASWKYPQQEADEDLQTELVAQGYGGEEVPA